MAHASWLPSDLRSFETDSPFPSRSIRGSAGGAWSRLPSAGRLDPPTPRTDECAALTDIAIRELHERIVSAPDSGDVGHCAARAFALDAPLDPALVPALIPTLPMGRVAGLGPTARFQNETYDNGIAALSPDRRRIAVLAATDTD